MPDNEFDLDDDFYDNLPDHDIPGPDEPRREDDEALPPIVVNWRTMDAADAAAAMDELTEWVQWLVQRYNVTNQALPACWASHTDLVEELSALHTAWKVAFDETDGGYGPIGWHERFAAALTRRAFQPRCQAGHREDRPRQLA